MVKPLEGWTRKVAAGYSGRPFTELIEEYRAGPQKWNPMSWDKVDEIANGGEMFIHHEDARRGQPDWAPRTFDEETTRTLTGMLDSRISKLPSASRRSALSPRCREAARSSSSRVSRLAISGEPGEILIGCPGGTPAGSS